MIYVYGTTNYDNGEGPNVKYFESEFKYIKTFLRKCRRICLRLIFKNSIEKPS